MSAILPDPDPLTEPFWAAAREHRLSLQRCGACGQVNHPPQPMCGYCESFDLAFVDLPGTGRVHSLTTTVRRSRATADWTDTIIVVEPDEAEGAFLLSRVPGERPTWARIDAPVQVWFEGVEDSQVVLPQFGPTDADEEQGEQRAR